MELNQAEGIIGVTDDGYPIITGRYVCAQWRPSEKCLFPLRECWYCAYADFRKTAAYTLQKSICRNPRCRMPVMRQARSSAKNDVL